MYVSLKEFLWTGVFAGIMPNTLMTQVFELLGEPDETNTTPRRRKHGHLDYYLYGSVKLYGMRNLYRYAFWDPSEHGEFRFSPRVKVLDWDWWPGMSQDQVKLWLSEQGLSLTTESPWPTLRLTSGAQVIFKDGLLATVATSGR